MPHRFLSQTLSTRFLTIICFALLGIASGCNPEEIQKYRVPKTHIVIRDNPKPIEGVPTSMIVNIVLIDKDAWFFKITSPPDLQKSESEKIDSWVQSIKFEKKDDSLSPVWKLPEGWTEKPFTQGFGTLAKFESGEGKKLIEISVTKTPFNPPQEKFFLSNINRWRMMQLGLEPISGNQVAANLKKMEINGQETYVFAANGHRKARSGMQPPKKIIPRPQRKESPITYEAPDHWKKIPPKPGFQEVALEVTEGTERAEIAISYARGPEVAHINRWRLQVGVRERLTQEQVDKMKQAVTVSGSKGYYYEMIGSENAVLAAIIPHNGKQCFFKISGPKKLVEREKANFKTFMNSTQIK